MDTPFNPDSLLAVRGAMWDLRVPFDAIRHVDIDPRSATIYLIGSEPRCNDAVAGWFCDFAPTTTRQKPGAWPSVEHLELVEGMAIRVVLSIDPDNRSLLERMGFTSSRISEPADNEISVARVDMDCKLCWRLHQANPDCPECLGTGRVSF